MKVEELLLDLIKIESFSGNEAGVADFIVDYLGSLDFDIEKQNVEGDRYNIIASRGNPKIFLSAHMDTVSGGLEIKEDSEKIYGRGACDTKGSIASMLVAGKNAIEKGMTDFGYLFTVGEEDNLAGSKTFSMSNKKLPFVVVGEPTSLKPVNGHYGILIIKVISVGKSAHTSNPELGENAIEKIIKADRNILDNLEVSPESSLTITKINGGTADNIVPDYAEVIYSIRISPKDTIDYVNLIRKILNENNCKIDVLLKINSTEMDMPKKLKFLGVPETARYCTDLSFLKNGFVLGPGNIVNAHRDNEFILKKELNDAIEIYEKILRKLIQI